MKLTIEVLYNSDTDTNHVVVTNELTGQVDDRVGLSLMDARTFIDNCITKHL